ncbi:TPA_asm: hypothetical protein G4G69_004848 [Salmonella enterica subsp. enterica serovar Eastbourne]|nr:hypothetical protein [Salmonella enterica subsp. enterica serovar Eastbourne]
MKGEAEGFCCESRSDLQGWNRLTLLHTMVASHRIQLHTRAGGGLVTSGRPYRLTPGFGGFTPVPYETTESRLTCR